MFEAFQVGPVIIWIHLVFLLVAIWLSTEFFLRLAVAANLSVADVKTDALKHLIAFVVCGRVLAILANYQAFLHNPLRVPILWDGEFSFVGGAIGIGFVLFLATRNQRSTFLQWLDVLLPATTFGLAFEWLGMFAAAQAYGKPTNLPWGVLMETFNVRYAVPIHPVQLYYALFYFVLTFALLLIRKNSKRAGAETMAGIVAITVAVFFFEFMRGDFSVPVFAKLTDFLFLLCLFASLGILAVIEQKLSERTNILYAVAVAIVTLGYVLLRTWIDLPEFQLRFSQVLSVLALLATIVYVTVHRRKYPHL